MKKLLTSILSVLMALTIVTTVSAAAGPKVGVKFNVPGESSNYFENAGGTWNENTLTITAKDFEGYEFSNWTVTVYDSETYNLDLSDPTNKTLSFTWPEMKDYSAEVNVVIVANYTEAKPEVTGGDNVSNPTEGTIDAVKAALEAEGKTMSNTAKITISAEITDVSVAAEDKAEAEKMATSTGGTYVAVGDTSTDYKFTATVVDGDTTNVIPAGSLSDLGDGNNVTVTLPCKTDASLLTAPSGYTREWHVIIKHDNGQIFGYLCRAITEDSVTFDVDKNSEIIGKYYIDKANTTPSHKAGDKDTNEDGIVDCVEENGKGWVWSQSKNACVYSVTNTSAK